MTGFSTKVLNNEAVVNYWAVPGDFEAGLTEAAADMTQYPGTFEYVEFQIHETNKEQAELRFANLPIIADATTFQQALNAAKLDVEEGFEAVTLEYFHIGDDAVVDVATKHSTDGLNTVITPAILAEIKDKVITIKITAV